MTASLPSGDRPSKTKRPPPSAAAFTLIEVLVVASVIALLISILLPSLGQVRTQAKLVVCGSNCHQVACMTAAYQSDYRGRVPVVLSWRANGFFGTPPRATWLSFALRRYDHRAGRPPTEYDPEAVGVWSAAKRERYEAEVLSEYFVCPFESAGPRREIGLPGSTEMEVTGRHEAIQTWGWEDIVRGYPDPPAKYSVLTWNAVAAGGPAPFPEAVGNPTDPKVLVTYRKWRSQDVRRLRSSFSEVTTAFCYQGEHMEYVYSESGLRGQAKRSDPRWNPGSHRTSRGGGSMAIFADSHVEWVPGPKIGWP